MKRVAILGATGSIGASTLDVIARHPRQFTACILTAQKNVDALISLCRQHRPSVAVIADAALETRLREGLSAAGLDTEARAGAQALCEAASHPDCGIVVAAIVGAAGLESTLAAARAGKKLLLANKEAVVMAGPLLREAVRAGGATLVPVDSEHNAVFQCLPPNASDLDAAGIRRIILTASGGPFRGKTRGELLTVTPEQACAHPNWNMGRKISVDSATLMNKGLEVIEAHWLFGANADQIEVVVHPQSVVHSMVDYVDGSVLAQLGNPDMRTAIAHALAWPQRIDSGVAALDLAALGQLQFEAPDTRTFRCLDLAYDALESGGTAPAIMNAANEVAVAAFLDGSLAFLSIGDLIEATLDAVACTPAGDLEALIHADLTARQQAQRIMPTMSC